MPVPLEVIYSDAEPGQGTIVQPNYSGGTITPDTQASSQPTTSQGFSLSKIPKGVWFGGGAAVLLILFLLFSKKGKRK